MDGRFQMLIVIPKTCVILSAEESLPHFFTPLTLKDFARALFFTLLKSARVQPERLRTTVTAASSCGLARISERSRSAAVSDPWPV